MGLIVINGRAILNFVDSLFFLNNLLASQLLFHHNNLSELYI